MDLMRDIPKYFTLKEMTVTSQKLRNVPEDWDTVFALIDTANRLDCIRSAFKKAIRVTSGFRTAAVNAAVGGSKTSAHCKGRAVDIQPYSNTKENRAALAQLLKDLLENFDQLIFYTADGKAPKTLDAYKWVHIGFADEPRKQLLHKKG